ncbi:UDP-sugar transporter protein [Musa troglodytarum]|uniref:UDP-sugar transporter protein n=1 Tax=Musa troglodytarum TaxID=320322 RepID=A0A9E7HE81_9LILI|nr:UDP-sugar transporter protein [Musa troglodytarum]
MIPWPHIDCEECPVRRAPFAGVSNRVPFCLASLKVVEWNRAPVRPSRLPRHPLRPSSSLPASLGSGSPDPCRHPDPVKKASDLAIPPESEGGEGRILLRVGLHRLDLWPSIVWTRFIFEMLKNGMIECSVCHSKLVSPSPRSVSRAYDKHRTRVSSKTRALNFLLVVGDCILVGLQPILVYMSKVDGKFKFSPISVNFLTEVAKVLFAVIMLLFQARQQKVGEKPLLSLSTFVQAARNNVLLAVPALLYAINNYLKFIMQLYFNPATVKMLSNLKVLVIAVLLKIIMRRRFSIIQWEALALLLIGISVNQLRSLPEGSMALGLPVTMVAYVYTLVFVTVPSMASVYIEYALKSQFETSIYLQNLFLYGYGAIFNFLGIIGTVIIKVLSTAVVFVCSFLHHCCLHPQLPLSSPPSSTASFTVAFVCIILLRLCLGPHLPPSLSSPLCAACSVDAAFIRSFLRHCRLRPQLPSPMLPSSATSSATIALLRPSSFNILEGHSKATMFLICNNAAQGILSSFFFKYADTILKKYSSTVATIFTGIASAALFGHALTMNFILGISIVFISMHQFFSPMAKVKDETPVGKLELMEAQHIRSKEASFVNMATGAAEDVSHRTGHDERQPLLPI